MKLAIVGCGVIGERRAQNLPTGFELIACVDPQVERAKKIASFGKNVQMYSSTEEFFKSTDVQAVILAGINSILVPTMQECDRRGIAVLVEKPAARSYKELKSLNPKNKNKIKVGFNHRFHPAYFDILKELQSRPDDEIMYIRASYGNGSRLGFEKEWRANPELSGGGELLDQGVHVLDLATRILPALEVKSSWVRTHYWKMPVDDNGWALLSTPQGQTFSMHVSSSEWKNEFRFEVYTRQRKYQWIGLGRSYGPETLTIYKMKPEMGPPDVEERKYPPEDQSWLLENTNFLKMIEGSEAVNGGYDDALRSMKLVEDIYLYSKKHHDIQTPHPTWWQG